MSQFNDQPNQSKSLPLLGELKPIQIDETIVAGGSEKHETNLEDFMSSMSLSQFVEQFAFLDDSEAEEFEDVDFQKRLQQILGHKYYEINKKKLNKYLEYLKQNIQTPCHLTGREDCEWEDEDFFKPGNDKESKKQKKARPSHRDIFKLVSFESVAEEEEGIIVNVQRLTDKKKFMLPLVDLKATEENSPNFQLVNDYATWFVTGLGLKPLSQ